ncbi:YhcH/YjgK/YiaL family protein [Streptococcus massiliensis]|uniref:Beta-galactosidase subunit beta n=1 Tax=Streptococcus massiliensis TaxID=313439 RepID=A0A380KZB6_9STRE|nr:YhcH/YjgK/YiaL family protein [Streptococcus massiliensis]SUN77088.1 beta-galactosidase subunit beta [Streptococcus massiliensis]
MIITDIKDLVNYASLNRNLGILGEFLNSWDIFQSNPGPIPVSGEEVFGNCFEYVADGKEGEFFETHHRYLDVHLVIENEEKMAMSSASHARVREEYDSEKDIAFFDGEVEQVVRLFKGNCLVTFPEDYHQPKVRVNEERVKKIVFKVKI